MSALLALVLFLSSAHSFWLGSQNIWACYIIFLTVVALTFFVLGVFAEKQWNFLELESSKSTALIGLLVPVAAIGGYRLWRLYTLPLWLDEGLHAFLSSKHSDVMTAAIEQGQPPLTYSITHSVFAIFGISDAVLRAPAFVAGIGFMCVLYFFVLKRTHSVVWSSLALVICATEQLINESSWIGRPLAVALLFWMIVLSTVTTSDTSTRSPERARLFGAALLLCLSLSLQPIIALVCVVTVIVFSQRRERWRALKPLLVALILFAPYGVYLGMQAKLESIPGTWTFMGAWNRAFPAQIVFDWIYRYGLFVFLSLIAVEVFLYKKTPRTAREKQALFLNRVAASFFVLLVVVHPLAFDFPLRSRYMLLFYPCAILAFLLVAGEFWKAGGVRRVFVVFGFLNMFCNLVFFQSSELIHENVRGVVEQSRAPSEISARPSMDDPPSEITLNFCIASRYCPNLQFLLFTAPDSTNTEFILAHDTRDEFVARPRPAITTWKIIWHREWSGKELPAEIVENDPTVSIFRDVGVVLFRIQTRAGDRAPVVQFLDRLLERSRLSLKELSDVSRLRAAVAQGQGFDGDEAAP